MSNGNHPHGDPNARGDGYAYGDEARQSYPQEGWGGEHDADATAFVQLPAGPLPPPGAGVEAWGPLAAPGTGQGGYTPPTLDPAEAGRQSSPGPATPAPSTDPASTGQWATPFGQQQYPGQGRGQQGGPMYGQQYADQYADQQAERYGQQSPGAQHPAPGQQSGQYGFPSAPSADPEVGQGAAAALAGSHEARTRRPLGGGGAPADPDEAEPIGPGIPLRHGARPRSSTTRRRRRSSQMRTHAGRCPSTGTARAAAQAAAARSAHAYALPHERDDENDDAGNSADVPGATGGATTRAGTRALGTVRSGLPWTPSYGTERPTGKAAD